MSSAPQQRRKIPWIKLAIGLVVLVIGAAVLLRGANVPALVERGMAAIRQSGPVPFFTVMALLPAVGIPLVFFTIPAGEAFAPVLTMPGVIAVVLAVLAVNLMLTYWLARHAFRPALTRLVRRYGYEIPKVTKENALTIALLVRLTPGPPYALQCYLLGLAEVPFWMYMIVSWVCTLPWAIGAVVMGRGILTGNFKVAVVGIGVIVAAIAAVHLVRRKLAKRERGH